MFQVDTKEILRELRVKKGLSQDDLAAQVRAHMEALVPTLARWKQSESVKSRAFGRRRPGFLTYFPPISRQRTTASCSRVTKSPH